MLFTERDQSFREFEDLIVALLPIKPADLVVLAIGIVVSVLATPEFVAT